MSTPSFPHLLFPNITTWFFPPTSCLDDADLICMARCAASTLCETSDTFYKAEAFCSFSWISVFKRGEENDKWMTNASASERKKLTKKDIPQPPREEFSKLRFALKLSHFKTEGSKQNKHPKNWESRDVEEQLVPLGNSHLFYHGT